MVHRKNVNTQSNEFEIWSCDPSEIPAWTPEAIKELDAVLIEIFGFDQEVPNEAIERTRCSDQGSVVNSNTGDDILE